MKLNIKKSPHLLYLDFIRVIAIIFVVIYHLVYHLNEFKFWPVAIYYINGINLGEDIGVSLFIFLSGMVLTYQNKNSFWNLNSLKRFYVKRLLRIWPLYILINTSVLAIFLIFGSQKLTFDPWGWSLTISGTGGYLSSFKVVNHWQYVGAWYLGFIIIMYLLFPALLSIYKKLRLKFIVICLAISIISSLILTGNNWFRFFTIRGMEFIWGIFFASLLQDNNNRTYLNIFLFSSLVFLISTFFPVNFPPIHIIKLLTIDLFFLSMAYLFCKKFSKKSSTATLIVFSAQISYAVFLIHHVVIINFLKVYTDVDHQFIIPLTASILLLIIILSWIMVKVENYLILKKI